MSECPPLPPYPPSDEDDDGTILFDEDEEQP